MKDAKLRWAKLLPTGPGGWLRFNPVPGGAVVRHDLFLDGGDLCVGDQGFAVRLKNWKLAKTFWWYGPVPAPPVG